MNFPSIEIQGSILSSEILGKIRSEQASHQQGKDFVSDLTNAKLKDEISLAWQEAKGQWKIFKSKLSRVKEGEAATTETRNFWITPLLTNLGYNLTYTNKAEELNGKSFPIRFRDAHRDNFPVYVGGYFESLDKRPDNKLLRVSPHSLMQEYLNYSEHLYGLVTNGHQLRLLRDASRITRLSYVEFNLEKIMEEDLYSDFVILYRLLHASRMPVKMDAGPESIIEKYHQEGLEAGATIRSKLGDAVKVAIQNLANGFLNHPANEKLRETYRQGKLDMDDYYRSLLRIIYRLLFLFVIEERNLVYRENGTKSNGATIKRFSQIYFKYYSLMRLRNLAKKLSPPEAERHYDLWQGLLNTFSLYEKQETGAKLGIMALQGDLFGYHALSNPYYDLHQCYLSNAVLLNIIRSLTYFENENKVLIAVNYGGLDVEEFGSVYEGLLELKLKTESVDGRDEYRCSFVQSSERSKSGSHYTPEELVQPLIKHSLDYLIEDKLKEKDPETGLLSLKVCDVACGSGHILLSAARRIALELARIQETKASNSREKVEQPSPAYVRHALKQVIRQCIYGVDKNPLAVELCKIALWLESFNPGEPLNFLDHHIKCGDAIVGLARRKELENGIATEAFKTLPGDDKEIAKSFRDKNKTEQIQKSQLEIFNNVVELEVNSVIEKYQLFKNLPETTPDEVKKKEKAYKNYQKSVSRIRLNQLADAQIAQFFIPKTKDTKNYLLTDAEYRNFLRNVNKGLGSLQSNKLSYAENIIAKEQRFFHWFLEFPEVFEKDGFDCILGNPPFLGGQKLSGTYGDAFLECIKYQFAPIGAVDLVTYFFRRIFTLIKQDGFQSLISTNTIAQGKAREDGLDVIVRMGGSINHAVKSMRWPGAAAVEVSLVTITKQTWKGKFYLGGKEVKTITPYLDDAETLGNPFPLKQNEGKSFQGSIVLGKGFVLEPHEAETLIKKDPRNKDVLFPYLNGDDLNNNPDQSPSRWVINFFDWPLRRYTNEEWEELEPKFQKNIRNLYDEGRTDTIAPPGYTGKCAMDYLACFEIVERLVKPEREKLLKGNSTAVDRGKKWWRYGRPTIKMYKEISSLNRVLVVARISKTVAFDLLNNEKVFADALVIFSYSSNDRLCILQSTIHNNWAWNYCTTMKADLNYTPGNTFETFPFPQNLNKEQEQLLEQIGETYHEHRRQLMLGMQLGLTKTYNLFHCNGITKEGTDEKDKQVAMLQKHLEKTADTVSFTEAIQGILKLRELHIQMDEAVLDAYGWNDIALKHDFYEVDYLPENDRIRFTIHPAARKEILKRLLALNHQIHDEEVKAGLWDKKGKIKKYLATDIQPGRADEPDSSYGGLFSQDWK